MTKTIEQLLRRAHVEIAPETFYLVGLSYETWAAILQRPELSSARQVPYMILRDTHEITLLIDEIDWGVMRVAAMEARVEGGFRLLTLDVKLDWQVVGFLAHVTRILAHENISVGAISAFTRDHLLIKQQDLPRALLTLGNHVAELNH